MIRNFLHYIRLDGELENFDTIHTAIERDVVFKGSNLWVLAFAIVVASIGLNMNSTAVVIGAMLISPLMGPINGIGYSVATYNFSLFQRAVKNFSFAVLASLIASTLYFAISPVSTAHSELLARTSPTIYDVLIALFGGLAGIVAISTKYKGNVIPGVAIATALMPPLCTAGYGLATANFTYLFGALYLFTINTVFIALAAVIVSQVLRFPIRTLIDDNRKARINRWITVVIFVTIIPSIYFGYGLVQKETFAENAARFVNNVSIVSGNYLLKSRIEAPKKTITLVYGGSSLTDRQKATIKEKTRDFALDDAHIIFKQGFSIDDIKTRQDLVDDLKAQIHQLTLALQEQEKLRNAMHERSALGEQLLAEIRPLYPQIRGCTYSQAIAFTDAAAEPQNVEVVVFTVKKGALNKGERKKIDLWIKAKLKSASVKTFYEQ